MAAGLLDASFEIHRDGGQRSCAAKRDLFEAKRNLSARSASSWGAGARSRR